MIDFKIHTFGCKANSYDSHLLENLLEKDASFGYAEGHKEPGLILVNTCTVTGSADSQARQFLRRLRRENPQARIFAFGCYARVFPEELRKCGVLDGIISESDPCSFLVELKKSLELFEKGASLPRELYLENFHGRTRAFVKIQDGCDSYCSYCIVPYARGKPVSMPQDKILRQLAILHDRGFKEVVLAGIHLGMYGKDLGDRNGLLRLLEKLEDGSKIERIRLSSIEPDELSPSLIDFISASKRVMKHLHLPIQSGDDDVLRRMRRNYTASCLADLFEKLIDKIPYCGIGADIIAGFPGESPRNFTNTIDLINILPVSYLHVFPFSARRGTGAYSMPGRLDPRMVNERVARLIALGKDKKKGFRSSLLGRKEDVLIEKRFDRETGFNRGLSGNYVPVVIRASREESLFNSVVSAIIEEIDNERVIARIL